MKSSSQIVNLFKTDLWKDQRVLDIDNSTGTPIMIKHYDSHEELLTEISVSHFLNSKGISGIPIIKKDEGLTARMPYYSGIRLFNLFVELDALKCDYKDKISQIKQILISKCEQRQREIQRELINWRSTQLGRIAYPHGKLKSIVDILSFCLDIDIQEGVIEDEINAINNYWCTAVEVPFRDATSKNMILNSPKLYMDNFESDEDRSAYLLSSIKNNTYYDWLEAQIIDIDFSSCVHDTTFEDDVISLKYHERTWGGALPSANELLWNGTPDPKRAAITFLVRYFRFGGRKAAYKLIHPSGHRIRFKYDNDLFYFSRLPQIMVNLWPECMLEYPNMMHFIETASKYLPMQQISTDLFLEYNSGHNRTYYTDVFPY